MIVSIDHGNKSIKTPTLLFTSGLVESTTKPGIQGDYIFWNGKYYSLTEKRISYLRGKTEDDRFYVLSLGLLQFRKTPHTTLLSKPLLSPGTSNSSF